MRMQSGSPVKRRAGASASPKGSAQQASDSKPPTKRRSYLFDEPVVRTSSYACEPTSKYGWTGGGANAGGVLQSIKVSEVEAPPPPPPRVFEGPSPEGAPFKSDPSKWGMVEHAKVRGTAMCCVACNGGD